MIAVGYNLSDSLVSSPASLQQVHAARPSRSLRRKLGMTESCRTEIKEPARVGQSSGSACKMVITCWVECRTIWTAAYNWQELCIAGPTTIVTLHRKTGPQVAAVIGDEIGGFQKSSCSKHVDQRMQVSKYFTIPPSYPPWCPKGERYLLFASFYIHFEQSLIRKVPNLQILLRRIML